MITLNSKPALSAPKRYTAQTRRDSKNPGLQTSVAITIAMMSSSRELPMPVVSRISSLSQAQATLLHCLAKLNKFTQEQTSAANYCWSPLSMGTERHTFQDWLERWEVAFGAFLSNAMSSMSAEEITLSRVLKSNHLACTILASEQISFDTFQNEFRAIVELAGVVLRSRHATDSLHRGKSGSPSRFTNPSLDVREPLVIVLSRCKQEPLRQRANELLQMSSSS